VADFDTAALKRSLDGRGMTMGNTPSVKLTAEEKIAVVRELERLMRLDKGLDRLAEALLPWSLQEGESAFDMAVRLLERAQEMERLVAEYRQDHEERVAEARSWRQRAERVEVAARETVRQAKTGMYTRIPNETMRALRAALAAAPAEEGDGCVICADPRGCAPGRCRRAAAPAPGREEEGDG
jgi:hypothetical protein